MSAAEAAPEQIATLRIELLDTEPVIWRQVEIPTAITLKGLHDVVQAAMGWDDQHLWELKLGRQRYGRPIPGDDWGGEPTLRAEKVMLAEVLKPRKTVFDYLYDFGDSWEHRLTITDVRPGEPDAVYPRYVAGEHAAPPEDCGGVPGFYAALEALADPDHPEHEHISDWLDGYDPTDLNELALKRAVGRIASRRKAPKRTASKTRPP
jgi:hypothetical protein